MAMTDPTNIFNLGLVYRVPFTGKLAPVKVFEHPKDGLPELIQQQISKFCFPYDDRADASLKNQEFVFVLSDSDGNQSYGFCYQQEPPTPGSDSYCFCIVTAHRWFRFFADLMRAFRTVFLNAKQPDTCRNMMQRVLEFKYPPGYRAIGGALPVPNQDEPSIAKGWTLQMPNLSTVLPLMDMPPVAKMCQLLNANAIVTIFASSLFERRMIVTSSSLGHVTSCIHSLNSMLWPLAWQHIFIPIMPRHLLDYCSAPMPFLMGVHSSFTQSVQRMPLEDHVHVLLDSNEIRAPFQDVAQVPSELISMLRNRLKKFSNTSDASIPRVFISFWVAIMGNYKDYINFDKKTFDKEAFVLSKPKGWHAFMQKLLQSQHMQQFIDMRLRKPIPKDDLFDQMIREEIIAQNKQKGLLNSFQDMLKQASAAAAAARDRSQTLNTFQSQARSQQGQQPAHHGHAAQASSHRPPQPSQSLSQLRESPRDRTKSAVPARHVSADDDTLLQQQQQDRRRSITSRTTTDQESASLAAAALSRSLSAEASEGDDADDDDRWTISNDAWLPGNARQASTSSLPVTGAGASAASASSLNASLSDSHMHSAEHHALGSSASDSVLPAMLVTADDGEGGDTDRATAAAAAATATGAAATASGGVSLEAPIKPRRQSVRAKVATGEEGGASAGAANGEEEPQPVAPPRRRKKEKAEAAAAAAATSAAEGDAANTSTSSSATTASSIMVSANSEAQDKAAAKSTSSGIHVDVSSTPTSPPAFDTTSLVPTIATTAAASNSNSDKSSTGASNTAEAASGAAAAGSAPGTPGSGRRLSKTASSAAVAAAAAASASVAAAAAAAAAVSAAAAAAAQSSSISPTSALPAAALSASATNSGGSSDAAPAVERYNLPAPPRADRHAHLQASQDPVIRRVTKPLAPVTASATASTAPTLAGASASAAHLPSPLLAAPARPRGSGSESKPRALVIDLSATAAALQKGKEDN